MKKVVVICGPTASGKSELAMHIARKYGGEIICADSRTIYKGMDIGTAKPSQKDRQEIPHHLLDICEPGQVFSAYTFQSLAKKCIGAIHAKGKLPIVVGGTGLYIDSLVYEYTFSSVAGHELREFLESTSLSQLYEYCRKNNINLPENYKNKRYVVRNIERKGMPGKRSTHINQHYIVVAIATDKDILKQRIIQRIEHMLQHGVVKEATILGKKYGWKNAAMRANIYELVGEHLSGRMTIEQLREKAVTRDWRLAKRQMTWLKRNKDITWLPHEKVVQYIADHLE